MYEYVTGSPDPVFRTAPGETVGPTIEAEAELLWRAARFASAHGVAEWQPGSSDGQRPDRRQALWQAASAWSARRHVAVDEAYELLADAVDARDRWPGLWVAATEEGSVAGWELRQLVQRHRDDPWADNLRLDAQLATRLAARPDLWHAVWRANRFLGQLRDLGLTDDQILRLVDEYGRVRDGGVDDEIRLREAAS